MIIGMIVNKFIQNSKFYKKISNLNFVKNKSIYNGIGVKITKWFVTKTIWKYFNPNLKIMKKPNYEDLKNLKKEMTNAEISHLIAFILVNFFVTFLFFNQKITFGLILLILNILLNFHPALLQQENKKE